MKNKKIFFLLIILILSLSACTGTVIQTDDQSSTRQAFSTSAEDAEILSSSDQALNSTSRSISVFYDTDDLKASESRAEMATIRLNGDSITVDGNGAVVDSSTVTIFEAGMYRISGTLTDGQIIVDTEDTESVFLVLNGASISSSTNAPIYIRNAEKTLLTLAAGTENFVTDGETYILADPESGEPNAAIFSNDDLTINGTGSLIVNANYKNGIVSNDDLKITAGNITVDAAKDGIKGKDSLAVLNGSITINAGGDGLQAYNVEEAEKGYIAIEGGVFTITAALDGIQAETRIVISDGDFTITTGGGNATAIHENTLGGTKYLQNSATQDDSTESSKGIKAEIDLTIRDGVFQIDAADDALHANDNLAINGGDFTLASGDDGIHADLSVVINNGHINITKSYEGIESANVTINNGTIHIVSSDDGFNAASGTGQGERDDGSMLIVNGGYVVIETDGDGFDSNGSSLITGGTVIVNGPTENRNGPLDVNGTLEIIGGHLVAVGSAGMPELPATSSTQNAIVIILASAQAGGTMLHIENENGADILSFMPAKNYQYVAVSSPDLQTNGTYNIYVGGSSTGSAVDGLYENGDYSGGSLVSNVTLSSTVTTIGNIGQGMMQGGHPQKGNHP